MNLVEQQLGNYSKFLKRIQKRSAPCLDNVIDLTEDENEDEFNLNFKIVFQL